MRIEILGVGCAKCAALAAHTKAAAEELGLEYDLRKVTDLSEIAARGVLLTPALAVDGKVKLTGEVASEAKVKSILAASLGP